MASLKNRYRQAIQAALSGSASTGQDTLRHDISRLPSALKNYLTNCGYTDVEPATHCRINWRYAHIRPMPGHEWQPLTCEQTNLIAQPGRYFYSERKLFAGLPLLEMDSFDNGEGRVLIKLLDHFTTTDIKGPDVDQAQLVTLLAEAILMPVYFFQPYIQWIELDRYTVKGTISYNGVEASGLFYFNEHNEFLRFETNDNLRIVKGRPEKLKWAAYAWNYQTANGLKYPSNFMAVWQTPGGDHPYFKGRIEPPVFYK